MNAKQDAKSKMYRAVETHCTTNAAIIGTISAFQTAFADFQAKLVEITNTTQLKDVVLVGIAMDKGNSRQSLCQIAADIAGIIFAFAAETSNNTLMEAVNFSFTALNKSREDQVIPRCQTIYDKGTENQAALKDYGIQAATLANLQTAISNYAAEAPKPRTATSHRKTMGSNLSDLFKTTDAILKNRMDKLVVNFRAANPDFVKTYESNRIIIDPSTTHTALKGTVTNKTDGKPIKNAAVTIVEANTTAKTNSSGKYLIKPVQTGTYTIKVTAIGFADKEFDDVHLKMGVGNVLDVGL